MAITNGYCTRKQLKERIFESQEDVEIITNYNDILDLIITAASRQIESEPHLRFGGTGRKFYGTSETRYYTPMNPMEIYIDDLTSITTLKTDPDGDRSYGYTWASTDYDLEPFNAALNNEPYWKIGVTPKGTYYFPSGLAKSVEIAGTFGYNSGVSTACPALIREACLIQSFKWFKRKDAPFGVTGSTNVGGELRLAKIPALDNDVAAMISHFRRKRELV